MLKSLKSLIGTKVTILLKDNEGQYYNDMYNETFFKEDYEWYFNHIKNEIYHITSIHIENDLSIITIEEV